MIYVWGICAAVGFLASFTVAARELRRRGIDPGIIWDLAPWIVISGLIGSRLYTVLLDSPDYYRSHLWEVPKIWAGGLSLFGGIIAGTATTLWLLHRRGMLRKDILDSMAFALPLGIGCGRIGCFLIHDHPGTLTHLVWGVRYPDGVRHDLGLELAVFDFALFALFLWIRRFKKVSNGFFIAAFIIIKSLARLWLDTYRIWDGPLAEPRYGVFTATQIIAIITLCITVVILVKMQTRLVARR